MLDDYRDHEQFHLHDIEDSIVEADIQLYIEFRLSEGEVRKALRALRPPFWRPSGEQKERLVGISGKLPIIASTAASFILDPRQLDPARQLALLLDGVSPTDFSGSRHTTIMDHMYTQIIKAAQPNPTGDWVDRFQTFVGTITLLRDPLPCDALAGLLGVDVNDILRALANLHSLLAPKGEPQTFRIHHKSFPDFISDPNRCKLGPEFFIEPRTHHLRIAMECLRVMDRDLRPNICNLTPDEWYKNRAQLRSRILDYISPHLAYACTYWASHLNAGLDYEVGPDAEVTFLLEVFAYKHLLPWVEALSIIGRVDTVVPSLKIACRAMQLGGSAESRRDALQDNTKQLDRGYMLHSSANTAETLFSHMCKLV